MINNQCLKIGLVVNPYAGIGGEAALKGSDGEARNDALLYSNNLRSPARTMRFLSAMGEEASHIQWIMPEGIMGEDYVSDYIPENSIVKLLGTEKDTSALDTVRVAADLMKYGIDLLVFVGGDGTARDIYDVVGHSIPVLGVPAGVKMQSAVFAINPETAAAIIKDILNVNLARLKEQDVRDIDEEALRQGIVRSKYYGSLLVPDEKRYLQHLKQGSMEDEGLVLDEIAEHLAEIMQDTGKVMLVGPGRTTAHWMQSLGLDYTLVGFDAICCGKIISSDLDGRQINTLIETYPDLFLVISPTGNQGSLIGRGNQQLTPFFLSRLTKPQWLVIASKSKLQALNSKPLLIDTNDLDLDRKLCGLYSVVTAYHEEVLYPANIIYYPEDLSTC